MVLRDSELSNIRAPTKGCRKALADTAVEMGPLLQEAGVATLPVALDKSATDLAGTSSRSC